MSKKEVRKVAKSDKFEPTAPMLAFAEVYVRERGNVTAVSEVLKWKNRKQYYDWCSKKPGFSEWLSEYAKDSVLKRYGKWYLLLEQYAARGSYSHLQLLFELAEKFVPTMRLTYEGVNDAELIKRAKEKGVLIPDAIQRRLNGNRSLQEMPEDI